MPENVTPEPASTGIREAITQAYDKVTATPEPTPGASTSTTDVKAPEPKAKPIEAKPAPIAEPEKKAADGRDEKGRFAPKAKTSETDAPPLGETTATEPAPVLETTEAKPPEPAIRAPASWTPSAREEWGKLPATVQAEVAKRERETARALQESVEARKAWGSFREAVAPYEAMVRAEGSDPTRAAVGLLQQAALLRQGTPQLKAQFVAQLVNAHGVDIEMLAQYIDGRTPQAPQQNPQQFRDPEFQEFKRQLQATAQQKDQQAKQQASQEIQAFAASHEFFDDVSEDVGDIIELGRRRGLQLSLEDAYTRAIKLHPDISKVTEQREAAKAAANAQASTQRAKAAAVSVRPEPAAQGIGAQSDSLRGSIERAIEKVSKR